MTTESNKEKLQNMIDLIFKNKDNINNGDYILINNILLELYQDNEEDVEIDIETQADIELRAEISFVRQGFHELMVKYEALEENNDEIASENCELTYLYNNMKVELWLVDNTDIKKNVREDYAKEIVRILEMGPKYFLLKEKDNSLIRDTYEQYIVIRKEEEEKRIEELKKLLRGHGYKFEEDKKEKVKKMKKCDRCMKEISYNSSFKKHQETRRCKEIWEESKK